MTRTAGGKRRVVLLATALIAAGTLSCDDSPTAPALTYPTTYAPLSARELAQRTARFERENPGYCTTLDAYGFTKDSHDCSYLRTGELTCSNLDELIQTATADVARNYQFTGVLHGDDLQVRMYSCRDLNNYPMLTLRFQNQVWNGMEVLGTQVMTHMNDAGVWSIIGHHYPDIYVPEPSVSIEAGKASLVGLVIHGFSYGGGYDYTVTEDSFVGEPSRIIYPYTIGTRIELHVAWNIQVAHWNVYVDTMTGERLAVDDQLVY